ncbi:hypothetical protein [Agrococcus sp. DT81.2]|uniref:Tc toxin subunit A-related protein n=1 Tax=Agrococcus sp. DT81.2 TaxID=3393414 RepID=UPI003CE50383
MTDKHLVGYHLSDTVSMVLEQAELSGFVFQQPDKRAERYTVHAHYHPYTDELIEKLTTDGLPAMLQPQYLETLVQSLVPGRYSPSSSVQGEFPVDEIDVSDDGPYAGYNWELFFHAPLAVAVHLSKNQRFLEARRWFHFIFDPTEQDKSQPVPQRFWKFLRFRQETDPEFIVELLEKLAAPEDSEIKRRMTEAIDQWRDRPFEPHVIARGRYLAYQLNVIMKYLDNLLAWGDSLFRQDTIETLNDATQLYVLAANLLGPRPARAPARGTVRPRTYAQLKAAGIDAFGNALVALENEFPFDAATSGAAGGAAGGGGPGGGPDAESVFGIGRSLYFCVPPNDKLLGYWDKVADRLFKIRNCMNIEGVVRQLPLFEPRIDPGVLVSAAAAGLDVAAVAAGLNQPVSTVRGPLLLAKAQEITTEVRGLGQAMLAAIERGEAEHLATLRHQHEGVIAGLTQDVRFLQWKEAEAATEALLTARATVFERYAHYKRILGVGQNDIDAQKVVTLVREELSAETFDTAFAALVQGYVRALPREAYRKESTVGGLMEFAGEAVTSLVGGRLGDTLPLNKNENAELNIFLPTADTFGTLSLIMKGVSAIMAYIPQFDAHATPIGVGVAAGFGGVQLSKGTSYLSDGASKIQAAFRDSADRAAKLAQYYRRAEDYVLQANIATAELEGYGRQILTALLREQVARSEYDVTSKSVEQHAAITEFLEQRFTTEELYTWMHGELSTLFHDAYSFAVDVARKAEQTLKHEVMRPELDAQSFVSFNHWDAGRGGLLAGERLALELKRLELAYLEQDRREYELTKHVSLVRLDPFSLLRLKATGSCEVDIPEWVYDLDSPGQYLRRIRSVGVTLPAVVGPYAGVHAKVSLLRSSVRTSSLLGDGYARSDPDDRFRDYGGAIQSVVTSGVREDTGTFDPASRDDRRAPFEGAGAISTWRLELPGGVPQFDVSTLSDVVLTIRYTAREAGHLAAPAVSALREDVVEQPGALVQLLELPGAFAVEWQRFAEAATDAVRVLELQLGVDDFPYWAGSAGIVDDLVLAFAVVDLEKRKLAVAPTSIPLTGDADAGWALRVDSGSPVFAFLKKHRASTVHALVSYALEP